MKFNNETIRIAVEEWLDDSKKAEKKYGHISNWDVSDVTYMSKLFMRAEFFNEDIGNWDVSNVTDFSWMFLGANSFNKYIGNWDVRKVTDMSSMFRVARNFNQDIGNWDVSNVTSMESMFMSAESFNQDIGSWDVRNVTDMGNMFLKASIFNQNIGKWDVGNVTDMTGMFTSAMLFNQNIGNWNVSNVTHMSYMFCIAKSFNQDIGKWDVSNVIEMDHMFNHAESFNQNLKNWKVNKESNISNIFLSTDSFNQNTNEWEWFISRNVKRNSKKHSDLYTDANPKGTIKKKINHDEIVRRVNWDETKDIGVITHFKGKPFTGVAFSLHYNGEIQEEVEMLDGLKHGKGFEYDENKNLLKTTVYENDLIIDFDENTWNVNCDRIIKNKSSNIKMDLTLNSLNCIIKEMKNDWLSDLYGENYYNNFERNIVRRLKELGKLQEFEKRWFELPDK